MDLAASYPGLAALPSRPGSYVLFLHLPSSVVLPVGRLGPVAFRTGLFAYVGNARGPGGLAARLRRHLRHPKPLRWHVDFLRARARPLAIWWAEGDAPKECFWAAVLGEWPGAYLPAPGLGASDCRCRTHLIGLPALPARAGFERAIGETIKEVRLDR